MTAYCERQSLQFDATVFLFDGRLLRPEQTPDEVTSLHLNPPFSLSFLNSLVQFTISSPKYRNFNVGILFSTAENGGWR